MGENEGVGGRSEREGLGGEEAGRAGAHTHEHQRAGARTRTLAITAVILLFQSLS